MSAEGLTFIIHERYLLFRSDLSVSQNRDNGTFRSFDVERPSVDRVIPGDEEHSWTHGIIAVAVD